MQEKKKFKILCIDGGGIKGLYSAQVLAKFEESFNTRLSDHFDLICGTSTGGIIALGVSAKIPMKDVVEFYENYGPKIFASKWKNLILGKLDTWSQASNMYVKIFSGPSTRSFNFSILQ